MIEEPDARMAARALLQMGVTRWVLPVEEWLEFGQRLWRAVEVESGVKISGLTAEHFRRVSE